MMSVTVLADFIEAILDLGICASFYFMEYYKFGKKYKKIARHISMTLFLSIFIFRIIILTITLRNLA